MPRHKSLHALPSPHKNTCGWSIPASAQVRERPRRPWNSVRDAFSKHDYLLTAHAVGAPRELSKG